MKIFVFALSCFVLSVSQAEQVIANPEVSTTKVTYNWNAFLELGDPGYTIFKAVHLGYWDTTHVDHAEHTEYNQVFASGVPTRHGTPLPTYNLRAGTHTYCSDVTLDSEFQGPGLTPLPAQDTVCQIACYDPCPNC